MAPSLDDLALYPLALRPGSVLGKRFQVLRALPGSSAFAVTYLANDLEARQRVVVKELLPRSVASRAADGRRVRAHSPEDERALGRYLRRFMREAELLAELDHPNLPRVIACFAAHGTACLVSDHAEGMPLAEHLAHRGGHLPADEAIAIVAALLDALQALHAEGVIHGHVTPDNVRITAGSRPLLLGFGTTRSVVGGAKEPTPGFAAIEQYSGRDVGPWTDVHGAAALLHHLLTGAPPVSAVERAAGRMLAPPSTGTGAPEPPPAVARVMTGALAVLPEGRPHSAEELRRRLLEAAEQRELPGEAQRALDVVIPTRTGLRVGVDDEPPMAQALATVLESLHFEPPVIPEPWSERIRRLARAPIAVGIAAFAVLLILGSVVLHGESGSDEEAESYPQWKAPVATDAAGDIGPPFSASALESGAGTSRHQLADSVIVLQSDGPPRLPDRSATGASAPAPGSDARRASAPRPGAVAPMASGLSTAALPVPMTVPAGIAGIAGVIMPFEATSELREQLAQGNVKAQFGDYVVAQRTFRAALDRVEQLSAAYPNEQTLPATRRSIEQAMQRARRACEAENTVLRSRSAAPVPCD